jgi:hypothetical protein
MTVSAACRLACHKVNDDGDRIERQVHHVSLAEDSAKTPRTIRERGAQAGTGRHRKGLLTWSFSGIGCCGQPSEPALKAGEPTGTQTPLLRNLVPRQATFAVSFRHISRERSLGSPVTFALVNRPGGRPRSIGT